MQSPLPVDRYVPDLVELVRRQRRAVVVAPPGSGKTTRIPPALTEIGRTILLQPRRVAARTLARRIAAERQWEIGREVGWQIRFERRFGADTRLLVATEGILTARLQSDPLLSDFSVIVLDEFHERSIHADVALALAREAVASRDDLALVVMSATIDPAPIASYLGGAPIVTIDTRTHPVEVRYAPERSTSAAVAEVARDARGHVLCFLPGMREIERVARELGRGDVHPLHGSLDVDAQERALAPSTSRRIILATNIAETSITVEGVSDVVDAGLQKVLRFDPGTAIDHLVTERISADSADQRAGRAGRTGPGRATRLWDARQILRREREPEIERVDLSSTLLDVIAWGGDPETFGWFQRPPSERIDAGLDLLERLGAIERHAARLRITALGERLKRAPLHPRLARVLHDAAGCELALRAVALLSGDLTSVPPGDILARAESMRTLPGLAELRQVARAPLQSGQEERIADERLRRALLAGYPERVAVRREPHGARVLLASGTGAELAREHDADDGDFIVALHLSGRDSGEAMVRLTSSVKKEWLAPTREELVHEEAGDRLRAVRRRWYGAILLSETGVAPDAEVLRRFKAGRAIERLEPNLVRRLAFAGLELDPEWLDGEGRLQLPHAEQKRLERLAPARIDLPSGRSTQLDYREDGSVHAAVKLQELFGLAETPLVGPARTPVTFALLAPNGRPVQVTRDLRSFWNGAYEQVRKELRGRYPKHPWPDDPWTAVATHRTKKSR